MVLTLLGSFAFIAVGAAMIAFDDGDGMAFMGILSIVFFGLCGVAALYALIRGVYVDIDERGIRDCSSALVTFIPWSSVAGFSSTGIFLVIELAGGYECPAILRPIVEINRKMSGGICVRINALQGSTKQIMNAITHHPGFKASPASRR